MTALRAKVIDDTMEKVSVLYLDRSTSKWWNARRSPSDTATFCGWYWVRGSDEAGPFKTRSSAIKDAYYRFVLNRELPSIAHAQIELASARIEANKTTRKKAQRAGSRPYA